MTGLVAQKEKPVNLIIEEEPIYAAGLSSRKGKKREHQADREGMQVDEDNVSYPPIDERQRLARLANLQKAREAKKL